MRELFDKEFVSSIEERFEEFRPPVKESHWNDMKHRLRDKGHHGPKLIVLMAMAASTLLGMNTVTVSELDSLRKNSPVEEIAATEPLEIQAVQEVVPSKKLSKQKNNQVAIPAVEDVALTESKSKNGIQLRWDPTSIKSEFSIKSSSSNSTFRNRYKSPIAIQDVDQPFSLPGVLPDGAAIPAERTSLEVDQLAFAGSDFAPSAQLISTYSVNVPGMENDYPILMIPNTFVPNDGVVTESLSFNGDGGNPAYTVSTSALSPVGSFQPEVENQVKSSDTEEVNSEQRVRANFLSTAKFSMKLRRNLKQEKTQISTFVKAPVPSQLTEDYLSFCTTGLEISIPLGGK